MAKITCVELLMVYLKPKVKRVDAIQSFVSQETPIVRITDADGVVGTGYSYTIGTGGHSVMALLQRTLAPALIGRDAVGAGLEIFTDANQAFAVDEAIRRARAYEPLDIGWLEEPLPADDIEGHVRLSAHTSLPIAVGESLYSHLHFREYLERHACSVVQVDVGRIGGITPWL
jgi:L-alanine-DL-glutamate epimerase-like enolase superfamily enzyme